MKILFYLLLWAFVPGSAFAACPAERHGKMLFVNLDYSTTEYAAAKDVANSRCLELVLVPPNNNVNSPDPSINGKSMFDVASRYFSLRLQQKNLKDAANAADAKQDSVKASALRQQATDLYQKIDPLKAAIVQAEETEPALKDQLANALDKIRAEHGYLDTSILSGHSDGRNFAGESSLELSHTTLEAISNKYADLFATNRHVMLMGCHTGTNRSAEIWQRVFPNATMFGGFEPKGPAGYEPSSGEYIKEVLGEAAKLDEKLHQTKKFDPKWLDAMKQFRAFNNTYAGVVYCGQEKWNHTVKCADAWVASLKDLYLPDGKFTALFTTPPTMDVSGQNLDDIYNSTRQSCYLTSLSAGDKQKILTMAQPMTEDELETWVKLKADQLLRMRFFPLEQRNFQTWFGPDLNELSKQARSAGISYRAPGFSGMDSWPSIVQSVDDLDQQLKQAESGTDPAKVAAAKALRDTIGYKALTAFRTLDPEVFCFKWINNGAVPKSRQESGATDVECQE